MDWAALKAANEPLNAFLDFDENARAGAGPLAGVTIGVKANIRVADLPFHAGIGALRERRATLDADVVQRLRDAGAVILGTLNMEEAALGAKTDNPHFGPVQNPHRLGFSPGGSSGGSGAAVAAGLCDAALGTDTLGSIRIPAAHCCIYGYKPATSDVSQDGLEPTDLMLDAIGPLARNLDMLQRVAFVMANLGAGFDDFDGATLVAHGVDIQSEIAATFQKVCKLLPRQPAAVQLDYPNARIRYAAFIRVSKVLGAHLSGVTTSDHLARLLTFGPARSAEDWAEDRTVLNRTADQVRAIVDQHGWLILPTTPNVPFAHTEREPASQADFTCLANIAGLPAISLPMGWTRDGLPLGVQIIGRKGYDAGLFAFARYLDGRLSAYRQPAQFGY